MIVAVDGHAASGKGTVAKAIAQRFDLPYLDTGLLYRAVAVKMLTEGIDLSDEKAAALAAATAEPGAIEEARLRSREAGEAASIVSAHPAVRRALLDRQRRFADQAGGAVLDGRDIGTVIAPHADVKLFVTASVAERARRRALELEAAGQPVDLTEMEADLAARDRRDSSRASAPLKPAEDAVLLDTSHLSREESVAKAIRIVEESCARP